MLFGVKAPLPEVVQMPLVALPSTMPPRAAVGSPAQIVWLPPALAVASGWMVTTTVAVAAPQGACWPVAVSVSVTVPVPIRSSMDGV